MTDKTKEQWYDECIALQKSGKIEEAAAGLAELIKAYPDYGLAYLASAVFLGQLDRYDEAMDQMHKACELESQDPFYYTAFSALAVKAGNHAEAEDALMKAQQAQFAEQVKKSENGN